MSKKEVVIPKGQEHYYEQYHFAPAVKDGNRLYCSGVIGVGPDGKPSSDPETQFTQAFDSLQSVLTTAGVTFDDVIDNDDLPCWSTKKPHRLHEGEGPLRESPLPFVDCDRDHGAGVSWWTRRN